MGRKVGGHPAPRTPPPAGDLGRRFIVHKDRVFGVFDSNLFEYLVTIELWHVGIGEDEVNFFFLQQAHDLGGVGSGHYGEADVF